MSWRETTLGELVKGFGGLIQTGPFGAQLKQSEYTEEGVPVIMPTDISDGRVNVNRIARVPEATASRLARHRIKPDTIVFPRRGEITKRAYITEEQSGWVCGTGCLKIEAPESVIFPKFLYYQMGTVDSVDWLQKNAVGATMLNLSGEILARYPVKFPDLPTQQRIAGILSAYDDLIEKNRRRIGLLEQAARLLYREWFVHLRFPGHETAKIVDGLPEGWERSTLGQVADEVDYGFTASASLDVDGPRFLRITDIVSGAINWHQVPRCEIPEGRLKKFSLKEGDVVVARTGATTGWARRIGELAEQAVFASYLVRFRFGQRIDPVLAATFMESDLYKTTIQGRLGGAAQPNASAKVLAGVEIAVPPRDLQDDFKRQISETNRFVDLLVKENAKLTRARDLLLPRLMDGRIPV